MKCPNCKNEIQPGQKFCEACGARLDKNKKSSGRGAKKSFKVGPLLIVLILVILAAFIFTKLNIFSGSGNQRIVYGVRGDAYDNNYSEMYSVDMNGKHHLEIYEDAPVDIHWNASQVPYFAEEGRLVQFLDFNEEELVILDTTDGTFDTYQPGGDFVFLAHFISDGKYIISNEEDGDEDILRILDTEGKEVLSIEDLTYIASMPNGKEILVNKWDYRKSEYGDVDEVGLVEIPSGDYSFVTSDVDEAGWSNLKVSDDGKILFYQDEEELISFKLSSGETEKIFETEGDTYLVYEITENGKVLALIEYDDYQSLYVYNLHNGEQTRVDRHVGSMLLTPDNKGIVYATYEGDDMYDLYYVKIDGSDKVRLAKNVYNLSYQLSPDGKHIVYLERSSYYEPGDLMITELKEEIPTQLDTDVWTYQFTDDGHTIVYSRVEDMNRGTPESEIYTIGINGRNKETVVEMDDGIFDILWPVSAYF